MVSRLTIASGRSPKQTCGRLKRDTRSLGIACHVKISIGCSQAVRFPVAMFDNSRRYRECISNYIAKEGKVSMADRVAFEDEIDKMTE